MAVYAIESDINDQLVIEGVPEAGPLSRFLADFALQDQVEYPDPTDPTVTLIDAALAWLLFEELVLSHEFRNRGPYPGRPDA